MGEAKRKRLTGSPQGPLPPQRTPRVKRVAMPRRRTSSSSRRRYSALEAYRRRIPVRMGPSSLDFTYLVPGLPIDMNGDDETGANVLLKGESAGLAIDFTVASGLGAVSVKGHTTNYSNVTADSFLTQSGTSPKLVNTPSGLVWSPHNLILRSQEFDNASWLQTSALGTTIAADNTAAPDGTTTAERITAAATSGVHGLYQSYTYISGATYSLSFYAKAGTHNFLTIDFNNTGILYATFNLSLGTVTDTGAGTTSAIASAGNGWYRISISAAVTTGASFPEFYLSQTGTSARGSWTPAGTETVYVWGAHLHRGPTLQTYRATTASAWFGVPIDYDAATGRYALLVEPAATNLALQARDLTNAVWTATNASVAKNAVGVDGVANSACTITASTTGALVYNNTNFTVAASTAYTVSFYAKAGTATGLKYALYDVSNAAFIVSDVAYTAGAGQFDRITVPVTTPAGCTAFRVYPLRNCASTGTVIIDQVQLETGSVATSPIPTFAATVTRAADNINVATSAFPYSSGGPMTFLVTGDAQTAQGGFFNMFLNSSNYVAMDSNGNRAAYLTTAGSNVADLSPGGTTNGVSAKLGAAYNTNDFAAVVNGGAVSTDASGALPAGLTTLRLGYSSNNTVSDTPVRIKNLTFLPRRMSNAELQARTA